MWLSTVPFGQVISASVVPIEMLSVALTVMLTDSALLIMAGDMLSAVTFGSELSIVKLAEYPEEHWLRLSQAWTRMW